MIKQPDFNFAINKENFKAYLEFIYDIAPAKIYFP